MVAGISNTLITTVQTTALACWEALKRVVEIIVEIAREAFECIYNFFASIDLEKTFNDVVSFVFCLDAEEDWGGGWENPDEEEQVYGRQPYQPYRRRNWDYEEEPVQIHQRANHTVSSVRVEGAGLVPYRLENCNLTDHPVNLEDLKETLRTRRGQPQVSKNMTIANFTTLCKAYPVHFRVENDRGEVIHEGDTDHIHQATEQLQEQKTQVIQRFAERDEGEREASKLRLVVIYPWERKAIGKWAKIWAQDRELTYDPTSKFAEVIQAAFQYRNEIGGGRFSSDNPDTYHPQDHNYYSRVNNFTYIVYTLLGFQALDDPETIELFYCLDDLSQSSSANCAYGFATSLSRIFTYPNATGAVDDIRHKLQLGLGACWTAYQTARQQGCIKDLFTEPPCLLGEYGNPNCFDLRVSNLQQFTQRKSTALFDLDFAPKCNHGDRVEVKVAAHVTAFRNVQIRDYVARHIERYARSPLTYPGMKELLGNMGWHQMGLGEDGIRIQGVPHPVDHDQTCSKEFMLAADQLPPHYLVEGAVIALQNPHDLRWYKVEVVSMNEGQVHCVNHTKAFEEDHYNLDVFEQYLQANGQPIREIALAAAEHPRVDHHRVRFYKRRTNIDFSPRYIPAEYRQVGQVIAILCPEDGQWYQAKVVSITPRMLRLDLTGLPLPREREGNDGWAQIIEQQAIM